MVTERVTGRPCFLVEHWLFIQLAREGAVSTFSPRGAAERAHGTPGWLSTLLGPEEAAASQGLPTRTACRRGSLDGDPRYMVPSVT